MDISNRINKCVRFHGKIWYQFNFIQIIFINNNRFLFGSLIFGIEWSWKTFRKPAAIKYYSNNCLIKWMLSNGVQHYRSSRTIWNTENNEIKPLTGHICQNIEIKFHEFMMWRPTNDLIRKIVIYFAYQTQRNLISMRNNYEMKCIKTHFFPVAYSSECSMY